ncbi:TetR/AcrR family transcriptional regulator [Leptospira idonii]|nr:TetR/AcrR family transcriptional regulator [Leptospira idonii]
MPRISETHREMRQKQILNAAWRCFFRSGVQATTMEDIIGEAGLSASAMYRYFKGKEDIIFSAISASLSELSVRLIPIFESMREKGPSEWITSVTTEIQNFSAKEEFNLLPIAIHGWSEAQRSESIRKLIAEFYLKIRLRLEILAEDWQKNGRISNVTSPANIAQTLMSLVLGFVAQTAITGDTTSLAHSEGISAFSVKRN